MDWCGSCSSFSFLQGTPASLVRYRVDQDRSPYSGSIFDVERETGRIVTKVNLNEDPSVTFKVSNWIWSIINNSGIHNDNSPNHQASQIPYHKYKNDLFLMFAALLCSLGRFSCQKCVTTNKIKNLFLQIHHCVCWFVLVIFPLFLCPWHKLDIGFFFLYIE